MNINPKVIVILGPTASGKTALAVKLCQKFSGVIISADSQQVYKYFDIGTAKEGKLFYPEQGRRNDSKDPLKICRKVGDIPQYLVDFVEPKEQFNLSQYQKLAYLKIDQIIRSGKIPFLVGGTGLYIEAVTEGYILQDQTTKNGVSRKELENKDLQWLLSKLKKVDPQSAKAIDPKNKRRIIRALEVTLNTGIPFSKQKIKTPPPYQFLKLGISKSKEELRQVIEKRTQKMLKNGLINETQKNIEKFGKNLPALTGIGYREVESFLKKEYDKTEMLEQITQNTKRYIKRQLTWFKRDKKIIWIENYEEAEKIVNRFL